MPERVIFEAGDPDFDDDKHDRDKRRIELGRKLIIVGSITIVFALLLVLLFILLVTGALPTSSCDEECVSSPAHSQVTITKDSFGTTQDGTAIERYTMTNEQKMVVQVITYGARVTAIRVPDVHGNIADVTLGFDSLTGYESSYFGGVLGRVVNRIAGAEFSVDDIVYHVTANDGRNHLHGGVKGWDKYVWEARVEADRIVMSRVSPSGEEGYPGEVFVNVTYLLTDDNRLLMTYTARTGQQATPINLSNGIFFNLAGEGSSNIYDHSVTIFADGYLPVTGERVPTGDISPVKDTAFDLRQPTELGSLIRNITRVDGDGIDQTYCLRGPDGKRLAARVHCKSTGRTLTVYTNQPAVHFYTGNELNYTQTGKHGHSYLQHSGFVLQTQGFPLAVVNHLNFPDTILREGSTYIHETVLAFSTGH